MNLAPFTDCVSRISWFRNSMQTMAFWGGYLIFAGLGSAVSIACFLPALLFRDTQANRIGQKLIHRLFAFFIGYLRACGLLKLDADALAPLRDSRSLILVANHPCLLDAVFIVSQLPHVVCLMKGSLVRNIVLCGTAHLAGYIHNESGLGLVRKCQERLQQGANLLVFPEGTRTVGESLHSFKMGFALVASITQSPVQTIIISTESNFLGKGWPFFKKPSFPVHYELRLGKRFFPTPEMDVKGFGSTVEEYFRSISARDSESVASARRI